MNDPQVVALIYAVEHGNSISYENAKPLHYSESPEFVLTVEDKTARFELKKFYADEGEALKEIEPFIQEWEFESGIRRGPNSFSLRYQRAEIVDRNPSPPKRGSGTHKLRAELVLPPVEIRAKITQVVPDYPSPPANSQFCLNDPDVIKMRSRYDQYRLGRTTLPDAAYFCVTVLEGKYGGLAEAARACGISRSVLKEARKLSSTKGGEQARKAIGADGEFTEQERRFLKAALKEIIIRAAQVAADDSQRCPLITMAALPSF